MYRQAQGTSSGQGYQESRADSQAQGSSKKDDNVVDAEFEDKG